MGVQAASQELGHVRAAASNALAQTSLQMQESQANAVNELSLLKASGEQGAYENQMYMLQEALAKEGIQGLLNAFKLAAGAY